MLDATAHDGDVYCCGSWQGIMTASSQPGFHTMPPAAIADDDADEWWRADSLVYWLPMTSPDKSNVHYYQSINLYSAKIPKFVIVWDVSMSNQLKVVLNRCTFSSVLKPVRDEADCTLLGRGPDFWSMWQEMMSIYYSKWWCLNRLWLNTRQLSIFSSCAVWHDYDIYLLITFKVWNSLYFFTACHFLIKYSQEYTAILRRQR